MMETPSFITRLPKGSQAYVFGSFLTRDQPKDVDVLILYDPSVCPPKSPYQTHALFIEEVREVYGLPVDITLLTYAEEQGSCFIHDTRAVPIADATRKLTFRSGRPSTAAIELRRQRVPIHPQFFSDVREEVLMIRD